MTERAQIDDLAARLTRESITAKVRIGVITAIGTDTKVQTDITDTAWLPRDQDAALFVGDRVWILQQGPMMLVAGRLSGIPPLTGVIRKSVQQDSSSTTFIDCDDMTVVLTPGVWRVQLLAHAVNNVATDDGDIKLTWTFSGTASGPRSSFGPGPATINIPGDTTTAGAGITRAQATSLTGSVSYGLTDGAVAAISEDLYLEVTAVGTLQLQFAQNTANATVTSLSTGTRLYVTPCSVLS